MTHRDPSLDALLQLDGESFVVDPLSRCWTRFLVRRTNASAERPHGLRYSLTLHDEYGKRLLGFDNAHSIQEAVGPGATRPIEYDHKHAGNRVRFYKYVDAGTLLEDFWTEVDRILRERST